MFKLVSGLWREVLQPMLRRPVRRQVAALCWREGERGLEVLIVSSRGTGRWILPKGWPMRGKDLAGAALQEAWEEAGVVFAPAPAVPIGRFASRKVSDSGLAEATEMEVFAARAEALVDDFPEAGQRRRLWATPQEAAELVDEAGLADLILKFGRRRRRCAG